MQYVFLGWVRIPLHHDEKLRTEYNMKKNEWIAHEIGGTVDKRALQRKSAAEMLSKDLVFSEMTQSGKSFVLSKEMQLALLERYMINGKTQRWNEMEMFRIVMEARMLVLSNLAEKRRANLNSEIPEKKEEKEFKREVEI